tara:strand:- start:104 stop:310 length:207 start_codon:yes stop_codon:yes gene_type:complete
MGKKYEVSYRVLHGDDGATLEPQVIKYLEEQSFSKDTIYYWETKGAPFYAHSGIAQAMVKIQEDKDDK